MHLIGEMLDAARTGPRDPALWGLAEALWGSTGVAHSVNECATATSSTRASVAWPRTSSCRAF
jgi:hypothetical protein